MTDAWRWPLAGPGSPRPSYPQVYREGVLQHKDVILAVLSASAALAGLVLVFLGLVATSVASYAPGTKKTIVAKARRPVYGILASFGLGVLCVGFATWWALLLRGSHPLYVVTVVLFVAQLASLVVATFWATYKTLWG